MPIKSNRIVQESTGREGKRHANDIFVYWDDENRNNEHSILFKEKSGTIE